MEELKPFWVCIKTVKTFLALVIGEESVISSGISSH